MSIAFERDLTSAIRELVEKRELRTQLSMVRGLGIGPSLLDARIAVLDARVWQLEEVTHDAGVIVSARGSVVLIGDLTEDAAAPPAVSEPASTHTCVAGVGSRAYQETNA